ncbi:hypothetical protein GCM10007036_26010 [Alsobacter metallidurans]|uniref:Acyltransferase 3 domain-containing protein n=1 Tax=Alsobacter metallidurans TaxID=340221 RepID=A0A917MI88_9HYPH|nr:hypothetical protein GCM10007036_26010 [Alsobacter metallidurans]
MIALTIMANHWADHSYENLIPQQQITIDIFFMIEGFLAAHLLGQSRATKASVIGHRLLEIYPLYFLGLLAGVAAVLAWPELREGWSNAGMVQSALIGVAGLPIFSVRAEGAVYPFNWPSWALLLEFCIFAVLCLAWPRLNVKRLAIAVGTAAVIHVGAYLVFRDLNMGWRTMNYAGGFARVCFGFGLGALLYLASRGWAARLPRLHPLALFAAYIAILFVRVRFVGLPLVLVAAPALVILASVSRPSGWFDAFCARCSPYAYSIYFMHFPVLVAFKTAAARWGAEQWVASLQSFVLATALVVGAAYLATRFYDAPLRRWIEGALWPKERSA